jgi:hypothetical protein
VKFIVKFLGVLLISIIYSFNFYGVNTSAQYLNFGNSSEIAKVSQHGTISLPFLFTSFESESAVFELENTSPNSIEDPFKDSSSVAEVTEQLMLNVFTQYSQTSRNFLIKFRKKDLIFPSHYFW